MEKRNEGFTCMGCALQVPKAKKTSRNHCPQCFLCIHVDDLLPGDRVSDCMGWMIPVEYIISNGKLKIHFTCVSCGKTHRNKTASDDAVVVLDEKIAFRNSKFMNV